MRASERTGSDGARVLKSMIVERVDARFDDRTFVAAIPVRRCTVCDDAMIINMRGLVKTAIAAAQTLQYVA